MDCIDKEYVSVLEIGKNRTSMAGPEVEFRKSICNSRAIMLAKVVFPSPPDHKAKNVLNRFFSLVAWIRMSRFFLLFPARHIHDIKILWPKSHIENYIWLFLVVGYHIRLELILANMADSTFRLLHDTSCLCICIHLFRRLKAVLHSKVILLGYFSFKGG